MAMGYAMPPPTDHTWRVVQRNYQSAIVLEDIHSMNFVDVCSTFGTTRTSTKANNVEVSLTGTLEVDAGVSEIGLTAGSAVEGATVFVEGYPDSEAYTGSDGAFILNLEVAESALKTQSLGLVMWYTKSTNNTSSTVKTWDGSALRIGARKDVTVDTSSAETVSAGSVALGYTKKARITVQDVGSGAAVNACWIQLPKYSQNVFLIPKEAESIL